jgi:hypothetical protein
MHFLDHFASPVFGVRVGYAKLQRGYRSKLMQALLSMELEGCFSESGTTLEHEKLNYPSSLASFMVMPIHRSLTQVVFFGHENTLRRSTPIPQVLVISMEFVPLFASQLLLPVECS